jgi:tripartite-type tricarboxylate transporter receptor subunit TctC
MGERRGAGPEILAALLMAAGLTVVAANPPSANAQDYPTQGIHFISAFPPGSGSDTVIRFLADKMRPLVNQPIVVENKPGAGGVIAAEYVARAKPDGHTIFTHAGNTMASVKHLLKKPPFDPAEAIQVAATINKQTFMLVVDARKPWHTLAELTAAMKEKGDKASYGASANIGLIMGALYRELAGLKAVDVQYRSAPDSLNDLASGAIDFALYDPVVAIAQVNSGRIRILGVGSRERLRSAPDLPTMAEQGIAIDLLSWFAALVPSATPKPIVQTINRLFSTVVAMDETRAFLAKFGTDPWIATPEEGQAQMLKDLAIWPEYIRIAKLKQQG